MRADNLIELLQKLPPDAEIGIDRWTHINYESMLASQNDRCDDANNFHADLVSEHQRLKAQLQDEKPTGERRKRLNHQYRVVNKLMKVQECVSRMTTGALAVIERAPDVFPADYYADDTDENCDS